MVLPHITLTNVNPAKLFSTGEILYLISVNVFLVTFFNFCDHTPWKNVGAHISVLSIGNL